MSKMLDNCCDYVVGPFIPLSFVPKLNWKITRSGPTDSPSKRRQIIFKARLGTQNIIVASSPYSYGLFDMTMSPANISWHYNTLDTSDPEEAIYLAEIILLRWAETHKKYYKRMKKLLSPHQRKTNEN